MSNYNTLFDVDVLIYPCPNFDNDLGNICFLRGIHVMMIFNRYKRYKYTNKPR